MTSLQQDNVVHVAKFDLFNNGSIKNTQELTSQVCNKISKLNREIDSQEVYATLLKGGRVYTTASYYQIR